LSATPGGRRDPLGNGLHPSIPVALPRHRPRPPGPLARSSIGPASFVRRPRLSRRQPAGVRGMTKRPGRSRAVVSRACTCSFAKTLTGRAADRKAGVHQEDQRDGPGAGHRPDVPQGARARLQRRIVPVTLACPRTVPRTASPNSLADAPCSRVSRSNRASTVTTYRCRPRPARTPHPVRPKSGRVPALRQPARKLFRRALPPPIRRRRIPGAAQPTAPSADENASSQYGKHHRTVSRPRSRWSATSGLPFGTPVGVPPLQGGEQPEAMTAPTARPYSASREISRPASDSALPAAAGKHRGAPWPCSRPSPGGAAAWPFRPRRS
jgi:hypothetical protein